MKLPHFSPLWFWIGVFVGSLFWYLAENVRWRVSRWREAAEKRRAAKRENQLRRSALEWRRWVAQHVQSNHIAAPLFPLEEIVIPPRLLPKPPAYLPADVPRPKDIATVAVPFTPDFPEAATLYRSPTLTWGETLSKGANLLLIAPAGAGKTVALSYLALQLARQDDQLGESADLIPVLLHASDLALPLDEKASPLDTLYDAIRHQHPPARVFSLFKARLSTWMEEGKIILLVDGADEMPPRRQPALADFLERLLADYPRVRIVVAASPAFSDGLQALGLVPVGLALWAEDRARSFLERWGARWQKFIAPSLPQDCPQVEPLILNRWLLGEGKVFLPLKLTLQAWAAYAGDALGTSLADAVEAYIRRTNLNDEDGRSALARLALHLALAGEPDHNPYSLPKSAGLLVQYGRETRFVHPMIGAYLAAEAVSEEDEASLLNGDWWEARTTLLGFLIRRDKGASLLAAMIEADSAPIHPLSLGLARSLVIAETANAISALVVKRLATLVVDFHHPLNVRARLASGLALSGAKGAGIFLRKLLSHPNFTNRWVASLAVGLRGDEKSVSQLIALLGSKSRALQRAASLALIAIGNMEALEAVASLLLEGDDEQRRIAAEALANHAGEGHSTLRDAARYPGDLQVRRAAVFGLARIEEEWALELLKQVRVEDSQWVVRDAAAAMVEQLESPSVFIPQPVRPPYELPWLIEFAAERGMGVPRGQAAIRLLHEALLEGSPLYQEAALDYVPYFPAEPWLDDIQPIIEGENGYLRDAAYLALWFLHIAGALA